MNNDRYFAYVLEVALGELQNSEMKICHGFLSPRRWSVGSQEDYSEALAWIESQGRVTTYKTSLAVPNRGEKTSWSLDEFYREFQPTFIVRYGTAQAVRLRGRFCSDGPWSDSLMKVKPLLPDEDTLVTNKLRASIAKIKKSKAKGHVTAKDMADKREEKRRASKQKT